MKVILFLDKENGMAFMNKRQSQDEKVRADLKDYLGNQKVYMNAYSYSLFQDYFKDSALVISDLTIVHDGYLLLENEFYNYPNVDTYILYYWNRLYPKTLAFKETLLNDFKLVSEKEFVGKSHSIITRKIYQRNDVK